MVCRILSIFLFFFFFFGLNRISIPRALIVPLKYEGDKPLTEFMNMSKNDAIVILQHG